MISRPIESRPSYRLQGTFFVLGSAACFATMGTIVKGAYDHGATATGLISLRLAIAAVIWIVASRFVDLKIPWRSPAVKRLSMAAIGGMGLATWSEYVAYRYLPVGLVVVVLFTAPAWVALAERALRGTRIGAGGMAGLILTVAGLMLLTNVSSGTSSLRGFFFAFLGSLGIAGFFLGSGDAIDELGPDRAAALSAWAPAVVLVSVALLDGTFIDSVSSRYILGQGALLAIVGTVIALMLLLRGISRLGPFAASIVSATEPVMAAGLAWWVLAEALTTYQILGGILVVLGTVVVEGWRPTASRPAA